MQNLIDIEVDRSEIGGDMLFNYGYKRLLKETNGIECKTEVDRYLIESSENLEDDSFDILLWWKVKYFESIRLNARDVLALSITSKSAFSNLHFEVHNLQKLWRYLFAHRIGYVRETMDEIKEIESSK